VAQRLEEDAKAGARGLKIFKDFGLSLKRSNGQRVPVDDPAFDEVFETCARLGLPVLIHTGEPAPFFDPVDDATNGGSSCRSIPSAAGRPPTTRRSRR
jgi:predicted TIM-barrel fold metal-dependent hydrolase